ncbi:mechanosensitive ion channel domain-containing protein [Pontibacter sp. G13]|uniref:mechanosensitive ion channel family protein n=1 Tax=Pontibacter sp. G13 TaxID=3074898 RepID=UPI00288BD37C|nr:mechanosensitive ion channel domain-containing protein [Pontibacter sp. G13]WNJ18475.1 mechanosensitive ion channel [Pontibacter sp. G13]
MKDWIIRWISWAAWLLAPMTGWGQTPDTLGIVIDSSEFYEETERFVLRPGDQSLLYYQDSLMVHGRGVPVRPFGDTLFGLYPSRRQPWRLARQERRRIEHYLIDLANRDRFVPDSLGIKADSAGLIILYGDSLITRIGLKESSLLRHSEEEVARWYADRIWGDLQANHADILKGKYWFLLASLIITILLILAINFAFSWVRKRVGKSNNTLAKISKVLTFKHVQLVTPDNAERTILGILGILRWVILLFVAYSLLPVILTKFGLTRDIGNTLMGWIIDPITGFFNSLVAFIPNLITIIIYIMIYRFILRGLVYIFQEIGAGNIRINGFYSEWAIPTLNLLKFLGIIFLLIFTFPLLPGSSGQTFQAISVFLGAVISLGSSSVVANAVGGVVLTYMRPFKKGDRIQAANVTGDVVERNILVTRIRTPKNEVVTVPNAQIVNSHAINYTTASKMGNLILHTSVTIGYDVPWEQVQELLITAANKTKGIITDNEMKQPFVLQTSLDDYYVAYEINAYTDKPTKMPAIYSELHKNIIIEFGKANVEILSPAYRANRDGNDLTIPENLLQLGREERKDSQSTEDKNPPPEDSK